MSVFKRPELEDSPLADLHAIADRLGIDGYRRLRRAELTDAIIAHGGESEAPPPPRKRRSSAAASEEEAPVAPKPRRRRATAAVEEAEPAPAKRMRATATAAVEEAEPAPAKRERATAAPGGRRGRAGEAAGSEPGATERVVEGVIELLGNGSAFVRVASPDSSDGDVYVSAAQVRRCELGAGDRVSGPVRPPRRSERYPALVRVDTINGESVGEPGDGAAFEELACGFPTQRLPLASEDETVAAIAHQAPIAKGSRALLYGPTQSGKSEALRRLVAALDGAAEIELNVVLAGVRPEEIASWRELGVELSATVSIAASPEARGHAVERAVERAKRAAREGSDVVVAIDTLDGLHPPAARRALAGARNLTEGGSVTVIATAQRLLGGETTAVAFDAARVATHLLPAIDYAASWTMRADLLASEAEADAIPVADAYPAEPPGA